jgi:sterol desaturase/sphingolipid hydroxylase (fatty acid hydroxylase superfamily)
MKSYWLDFILYPVIALGLAAMFCRSWDWVGWAAFGAVFFTFAEYWVHRSLLHRWFYHGTHERHHKEPEEFVVFPLWYVPSIFFCFSLVMPPAVFAGFCLGYTWFVVWHHMLHHWDLAKRPLTRRYAAWHDLHHKFIRCNFGITHPLWDVVFGTYRRGKP